MRSTFSIILLALTLVVVFQVRALSRPQIKLQLDDSVYVLREPIWILATLKNDSSVLLRCGMYRYEGDLRLKLTNTAGDTFSYSGVFVDAARPREQTLGFGDELAKRGDLFDFYGVSDQGAFMKFLPPGDYTVRAYLHLKAGNLYWSDPVNFRVVEPIGVDRSQHDSLVEARKAYGERNWDKCDQIYDKLIDRFPDGRYSDLVLYESAMTMLYRREDVYEAKMIQLFHSYNESILAEEVLPNFVRHLLGRKRADEAVRLLQTLERVYPASCIGRSSKEMLNLM